MNKKIIFNTVNLIINIIIAPKRLFMSIKDGKYVEETYLIFTLAAIITFIKSFMIKQPTFSASYYNYELLNRTIELLHNAHVSWFISYLSYFVFLFIVFLFCRIFDKRVLYKNVVLSLMVISAIGVTAQITFFLLSFILQEHVLFICGYLVFLWVICLSIIAINVTQTLSLARSIVCFIVPAVPFSLFIVFVSIAPYLAWLLGKS